jgi:hypothetical protein
MIQYHAYELCVVLKGLHLTSGFQIHISHRTGVFECKCTKLIRHEKHQTLILKQQTNKKILHICSVRECIGSVENAEKHQ